MKPYYEHAGITIYHADCRELLPSLDKVDVVVTDPPYFVPAVHHATREGTSKSWGNLSILEHFFRDTFREFPIKSSGCAYVFCNGQSYPIMYRAAYDVFKNLNVLVWDKGNSINGYWWRHQHELIMFCTLQETPLHPTGDGDVIEEPCVPIHDRVHDAEKPLPLIKRFVAKGNHEIVLDPFMGSGTTLRAAKDLGRRAIGIEIEERYCEIAARRLDQEVLQFTPEPMK
jgi:site-specific DNA-methyltransferase (adenine-specific)